MARYETVVHTPRSPEDAFAYMADLRNFEQWDPGIESSTQVVGDGPGVGAEYDIEMSMMTLRYVTTEYDAPARVKVEAHSRLLSSFDTITVKARGSGSDVRYEAEIRLGGPLRLLDPLFNLVFQRIGDKASAGMARALDGYEISEDKETDTRV